MKCEKCNKYLDVASLLGQYYGNLRKIGCKDSWTEEEDQLIAKTIDDPLKQVADLFPNRTYAAVHCRRRDYKSGRIEEIKNFKLLCDCGAEIDIEELKRHHTEFRWNKAKKKKLKNLKYGVKL